jgi:ATP-dependent Lon protease
VPDNIKENLDIRPVKWIDEVLSIALEYSPEPLSDEDYMKERASLSTTEDPSGETNETKRPRSH